MDSGGRTDLRAWPEVCGYTARDGYMHGASPYFDIAASAHVAAILKIEAMRPPLGEHGVRIRVDCDNERLAVASVTIVVR